MLEKSKYIKSRLNQLLINQNKIQKAKLRELVTKPTEMLGD